MKRKNRKSVAQLKELFEKCDHFHDWVIWNVSITPECASEIQAGVQPIYCADLTLIDPYVRSSTDRVTFDFFAVQTLKIDGLCTTQSELSGLILRQSSSGVCLTADCGDDLIIVAKEIFVVEGGSSPDLAAT